MDLNEISVGKVGFVEQHNLWDDAQKQAAEQVLQQVRDAGLTQVRISWCDQHGLARGKTVLAEDFATTLRNGMDFQSATLIMDTTNNIFVPLFVSGGGFGIPEMTGYPDVLLVPDPRTFQILPWAEGTGWVLSDMYFSNGKPVPFSTRQIMRRALEELHQEGYEYVAGLEVEFYITKMEDPMLKPEQAGWPPDPPQVSTIAHGFQYLTESRNDEIDEILQILSRNLRAIGLPLRTMEDEWGPGQSEFTFDPQFGLDSADAMVLFRTATKQICRRHGYHASFMTRPALPNFFSSGWHLHESLMDLGTEQNAFVNRGDSSSPLSDVGRYFVGGVLQHASAGSAFSTPTINGYKRFQPNSFAPNKASWSVENRGAMIRVIGGPGDEVTHLENRMGEPCANPYLYMASQILAGLDGLRNQIDPGEPDPEPYNADRPALPQSLMAAMEALRADGAVYRKSMGDQWIDYFLMLKQSEIDRFLSHVTDWEQREYFELY